MLPRKVKLYPAFKKLGQHGSPEEASCSCLAGTLPYKDRALHFSNLIIEFSGKITSPLKVMKKPGGQENEPTTVQNKPSSKEADPSLGEDQKEEEQKEDVGEEEQEEENKEEDPEVEVDSTKLPVTLKNMNTHDNLLASKG